MNQSCNFFASNGKKDSVCVIFSVWGKFGVKNFEFLQTIVYELLLEGARGRSFTLQEKYFYVGFERNNRLNRKIIIIIESLHK